MVSTDDGIFPTPTGDPTTWATQGTGTTQTQSDNTTTQNLQKTTNTDFDLGFGDEEVSQKAELPVSEEFALEETPAKTELQAELADFTLDFPSEKVESVPDVSLEISEDIPSPELPSSLPVEEISPPEITENPTSETIELSSLPRETAPILEETPVSEPAETSSSDLDLSNDFLLDFSEPTTEPTPEANGDVQPSVSLQEEIPQQEGISEDTSGSLDTSTLLESTWEEAPNLIDSLPLDSGENTLESTFPSALTENSDTNTPLNLNESELPNNNEERAFPENTSPPSLSWESLEPTTTFLGSIEEDNSDVLGGETTMLSDASPTFIPADQTTGEESFLTSAEEVVPEPFPNDTAPQDAFSTTAFTSAEDQSFPTFQPTEDSSAQPSEETPSSYDPTPEAFEQTMSALQSAKEAGDTTMSSSELDQNIATSLKEGGTEKVLDLDQMVAKFKGEEIPEDKFSLNDDPFAPMKKALEEEEKKDLKEKGVELTEEISPTITPEVEELAPVTETSPPELQSEPIQEEVPESPTETVDEVLPETDPVQAEGILSLDQLLTNDTLNIAPQPEKSTEKKKKKQSSMIFALASGAIVLVGGLVVYMMYPGLFDFSGTENPDTQHAAPPIEDILNVDPNGEEVLEPTVPTEPEQQEVIPPEENNPFETAENTPPPFVEEELPTIPEEPSISSSEMTATLNSLYAQGEIYFTIGTEDDDAFVIKYASYVQYQSDILRNTLASGESLDIDYYVTTIQDLNQVLSTVQAYLNGEYEPTLSQEISSDFDQAALEQELTDFVYNANR